MAVSPTGTLLAFVPLGCQPTLLMETFPSWVHRHTGATRPLLSVPFGHLSVHKPYFDLQVRHSCWTFISPSLGDDPLDHDLPCESPRPFVLLQSMFGPKKARSSRETLPSSPSIAPSAQLATCTAFLASSVRLGELNPFCCRPSYTHPFCSQKAALARSFLRKRKWMPNRCP